MLENIRLALLVDPLSARAPSAARVKSFQHARELGVALEARGHHARVFGVGDGEDTPGPGLAAFAPNAILAYDALSPAAWQGSRLARRHRIPLVLVEAGSFAEGSWMERTAWRLGEVLWGTLVRRTAGELVALDPVARSHALREGFADERVHVLPHGVDTDEFRPGLVSPLVRRHRIRGRILLHPGPLDARSGTETLIQAFSRSLGQRDDWSLVLLARGRPAVRVRAAADRSGVGSRIHVLTAADHELPGLYSCATLVALPTREDAPTGGALARALAAARPVLASDLPRLRFLCEPAGAGLFALPGDVDDWTRALRQAASAPEARKRWSQCARRAAEETLAWPRLAQEFERLVRAADQRVPRNGPKSSIAGKRAPRGEGSAAMTAEKAG